MSDLRTSVCLPVHDPDRAHLAVMLDSIRAQTRPPDEIVVSDDCSSFDVAALVQQLAGDLDVRVVRQERNLGMTGNWNAAVRATSGDLVLSAHQDDALEPTLLERYVATFDDPDVVVCSSNERCIDEHGEPVSPGGVNRRGNVYVHRPEYRLDHDELTYLCLRNGQAFGEPTAVMVRRSAYDAVGGYADRYEHAADVDLVLRATRHGTAAYLRDVLVVRRIHSSNLTQHHIGDGATGRDRDRLLADHLPTIDVSRSERSAILVAHASHAAYDLLRALRARRWPVVRSSLLQLVRHGLRSPAQWWRQVQEVRTGRNRDER